MNGSIKHLNKFKSLSSGGGGGGNNIIVYKYLPTSV